MAKKKAPPSFLIKFEPMRVSIEHRGKGSKFGKADSLYIRTEHGVASIQYAGDIAEDAYNLIQMPSEPEFLRKLAKQLKALAKKLDPTE
ncbi:hypothetical protein [Pseudomonas sp. FP2254]|uniref:hypothetical protein n=1 Tax=unclassified Pseudomonas TaxID=196821 RepID=UPI00273437A2|nr:hypothetical protein [Pseudomonas sp. FP2254]WLH42075.1 hypothetical protein PSH94_05790 [Pseudomonas sp. FP2254]